MVPEVVGSSPSSLSEESSPETDFIPEPRAETSKYGRKRTRAERDNYGSCEKISINQSINQSTLLNTVNGSASSFSDMPCDNFNL